MSLSYAYGDFSFITCNLVRQTMIEDFNIINSKNLWNILKTHDKNRPFMYDPNWNNIELSQNHSGASHALSLRSFETIAKSGWDAYVRIYLANNTN